MYVDDKKKRALHLLLRSVAYCAVVRAFAAGKILDDLLAGQEGGDLARSADKVIYVGDGGGDYCPALRLR